jgi:hypothetical protein
LPGFDDHRFARDYESAFERIWLAGEYRGVDKGALFLVAFFSNQYVFLSYCSDERTIILCVVPANQDLTT